MSETMSEKCQGGGGWGSLEESNCLQLQFPENVSHKTCSKVVSPRCCQILRFLEIESFLCRAAGCLHVPKVASWRVKSSRTSLWPSNSLIEVKRSNWLDWWVMPWVSVRCCEEFALRIYPLCLSVYLIHSDSWVSVTLTLISTFFQALFLTRSLPIYGWMCKQQKGERTFQPEVSLLPPQVPRGWFVWIRSPCHVNSTAAKFTSGSLALVVPYLRSWINLRLRTLSATMIFGPQNGWHLPEILPELCFASQPSWLSSLPGERTGTVWFELFEQQFRSFGMVSSMHCRAASTSQTASGCCLSHDILQVFSVNKQLHAIAAIMIQHDSTMLLLKKLTIKNGKNLLMMHFVSAWKFSRKSPASSTS